MRSTKTTESALWKLINKSCITPDKIQDLNDFKSSGVNFRIAIWNPQTNGMRYLKTLIYNLCAELSPQNWDRLSKIKNRTVGEPISVTYDGHIVCLDYLQAVYENEFIADHLPLDEVNILEIGAGYGRTCHSILSNHLVKSYTILDLPNCLELSRRYLIEVLNDEDLSKVNFIKATDLPDMDMHHFNLCINIDSFAEMEPDVVKYYLNYIGSHCDSLYVKNPVGKYKDPSLNTTPEGNQIAIALSMGVLRDVLDIHDSRAIIKHSQKFLAAYRPGAHWRLVANSWAQPWSYYWQAIYRRSGNSRQPAHGKRLKTGYSANTGEER
ncbi:putative sugar O-methyltransferase [bacterium]|nr:MAG: putative sugar O-methyltransferase [bacterium]